MTFCRIQFEFTNLVSSVIHNLSTFVDKFAYPVENYVEEQANGLKDKETG
jgi:hypothetical protein